MYKQILTLCNVILTLVLISGCGDDSTPTQPDQPQVVRVVVAEPATSPSLTSVDDPAWNSITAARIDVAVQNAIGSFIGISNAFSGFASLSDSLTLQAARHDDSLWLRLQWSDNTFDAWRSAYVVDSVTSCDGVNPCVWFRRDDISLNEDQVLVLFSGLDDNLWDAINWRVLTTGSGNLAQGMHLRWDTAGPALDTFALLSDAINTDLIIAHANGQFSTLPAYFHPDTSDYTGHLLYLDEWRAASPLIGGWTVGQRVPGFWLDTSIAGRSPQIRGSRWDTHAAFSYNATAGRYTLLLAWPMNTGFADDLNLLTHDSVETQIGLFDNFLNIQGGSTHKGFTKKFWLIL